MKFVRGAIFGGIVVGSVAHFVGYVRGCFAGYAIGSHDSKPTETTNE